MKIGAHLSTSGGLEKTFKKAREIGAECLQIFSSSPRDWNMPKPLMVKLELSPVYFHAGYLINLADGKVIGEKSKKLLIAELQIASQMGIKGSVVHLGSFKDKNDFETLVKNINDVLLNTPDNALLIMENSGNKKIGQDLNEISQILKLVSSSRLRVCLDTCHLFAAGYLPNDLDNIDFWDTVELIHINDSKDDFKSGRDRHENIGQGKMELEIFEQFLNNPKLQNIPFITEVPGLDGFGPDKKNLDILKSLVNC